MGQHKEKIELLRKYSSQIKTSFEFHVGTDIPSKKFDNAISTFAKSLDRSTAIGFYDTTVMGNGKQGYVFTDTSVYYLETGEFPKRLWYADIQRVEVYGTSKKDCYKSIKFFLSNGEVVSWDSSFLNKSPLAEFLKELLELEGEPVSRSTENQNQELEPIPLEETGSKKQTALCKTVLCGDESVTISKETIAVICKAPTEDLLEFEQKKNGVYCSPHDTFSSSLFISLKRILNDFAGEIGNRLPAPRLTHDDLKTYRSDYKDLENMKKWRYQHTDSLRFLSTFFDCTGNAEIIWNFSVYKPDDHPAENSSKTCRTVWLSDIIPILKTLIDSPKGAWSSFWGGYSYKKNQKELPIVYEEYMRAKTPLDSRNAARQQFLEEFGAQSILYIKLGEAEPPKKYLEGFCGFDIFEKEAEIKNIQEKLKSSYNEGEKAVEYALKWFLSSNSHYAVPIKADCESRYRYDCILLCKADFINEAQEYDHILVTPAGIVLIETKHWKGNVTIRPDGKWLRKPDAESPAVGIESPKLQMRRHEIVMQEILPNVPVYSVLCFSNSSVIVDGRENFSDYPVITIDQLEETLSSLCSTSKYSKEEIDQMVETINAYKVNIP